ncbi:serine/arginine repetitive matrix protein 2 [Lutispora thermophila]|uniref:Uncharacterized protein n=1 Tax=Lutispora thermophila DSM 19022 TaxID=1122184 RepID=A0A1M6ERX8_9FIRM|nr:serine/arginine repetitive matrix protein 2 [Lutispora thermophila]SHI88198.1 hypothetical protein SAMN02745176_01664 [Lutispora thermophila DSM 19022]
MAGFKEFGEYMFSLLFTPLRKGKKAANQFYIFFKVVGKLFDDTKRDIFRVRAESMVISASEVMLPEHGKDRDMPRLKGEDIEAYRTRLSMKAIIAEQAGTREGVLLALKALGYEQSYIEPFYKTDPERWAEFIIFLRGKNPSGINDIRIIDAEVMKVKEASAKPNYGVDSGNVLGIRSMGQSGFSGYPLCGTVVCGIFPVAVCVGYMVASEGAVQSQSSGAIKEYPLTGRTMTSKKTYHEENCSLYYGFNSVSEVKSSAHDGEVIYPLASEKTMTKGDD